MHAVARLALGASLLTAAVTAPVGCGGKRVTTGGSGGAKAIAVAAPAAAPVSVSGAAAQSAPSSSVPAGSGSIGTPSPLSTAPLGPVELVRSERAGLTIVLASERAQATIVNERTGEWRQAALRTEGETSTIEALGARLVLTGSGPKRRLALGLGRSTARAFDAAVVKGVSPVVGGAYTFEGELLTTEALGSLTKLSFGTTAVVWRSGFLPAGPGFTTPTKLALGARVVDPVPMPLRHEGRCAIVGVRPTCEGPLGETLLGAQRAEAARLCRGRMEDTLVEASYAFVRFKGVNLEQGYAPDPTDVVGLNLSFRLTDTKGSALVETGYLVGLAKGEIASLASLLKPSGPAFLASLAGDAYQPTPPNFGALSRADSAAALDLGADNATLSLGPSTVDIVIPTEPFGLFLGNHRVQLGPRSVLAPAFVRGSLTQRLVAMVLVDY